MCQRVHTGESYILIIYMRWAFKHYSFHMEHNIGYVGNTIKPPESIRWPWRMKLGFGSRYNVRRGFAAHSLNDRLAITSSRQLCAPLLRPRRLNDHHHSCLEDLGVGVTTISAVGGAHKAAGWRLWLESRESCTNVLHGAVGIPV